MRVTATAGDFRAKAIAGTHTVLLAIDCAEPRRQGLLGFAIKREIGGGGQAEVARLAQGVQVGRSP